VQFDLCRFRFQFRALDAVYFPAGKSGNVVRGAFGTIFRKIACMPDCRDAVSCAIRAACPYARMFEPREARGEGPSGLQNWPRPFVFRASHLDGRAVAPGETFCFDVHSFDVRDPSLRYFVSSFTQLAQEGLGPRRGRAELVRVEQVRVAVELGAEPQPVRRVCIRFVTPTELKNDHEVASQPEFAILFARLRDRISTLRALYGPGPLEIDFRAMGQRAHAVSLASCKLRWVDAQRRSARTGQAHSLGGFVGEAEYEGELSEFLPYLRAGQWTGLGRQTVWGKGQIEVVNPKGQRSTEVVEKIGGDDGTRTRDLRRDRPAF
jgi:hypothetical protein